LHGTAVKILKIVKKRITAVFINYLLRTLLHDIPRYLLRISVVWHP